VHKVPAAEKARSIIFNWGRRDRQQVIIIGLYELQNAPLTLTTHTQPFQFVSLPLRICHRRQQRSWCKNANPKPAGFADCPNPGFGFGKMSGFSRGPGFSTPGFQSLVSRKKRGHSILGITLTNLVTVDSRALSFKRPLLSVDVNVCGCVCVSATLRSNISETDVTWPYDVIPVTLLYANFGAPYLQFYRVRLKKWPNTKNVITR